MIIIAWSSALRIAAVLIRSIVTGDSRMRSGNLDAATTISWPNIFVGLRSVDIL